jgi:hypothetical protein
MGAQDQQLFIDAVARARAGGHVNFIGDPYSSSESWVSALFACNRMAMFDILPALKAINPEGKDDIEFLTVVEDNRKTLGGGTDRIKFAYAVVTRREIEDRGQPDDQVNDGREFLGCTRLDDTRVQAEIQGALRRVGSGRAGDSCCGAITGAWLDDLVPQRQAPGKSLISNVAAAAHYMLSRSHVCSARASVWGMKQVIDEYDAKKRRAISGGDKDLKGMALTGNRPFPPDFAMRKWAYKGADDGFIDWQRCNSTKIPPFIPNVKGVPEGGEF